MKTKVYLKISSTGVVKATKSHVSPGNDEITLGVDIELPDSLFRRPQIEASIKVDKEYAQPLTISAETANKVQDAIKQSTGLDIVFKVINPEEDVTTTTGN